MGRKRKGKKNVGVAPTYDSDDERAYAGEAVPDPNDSDYFDDEIDQFHKQRDKILLDRGVKYQDDVPSSNEEEVMAFDDIDSDEEDAEIEKLEKQLKMIKRAGFKEKLASDVEDSSEEEEEEEKTWGGKKRRYYGGNLRDYDDVDSGASDTEAPIMEEKEALAMQQKYAEQMDDADFGFEELMNTPMEDEDPLARINEGEKIVIPKDLSKLSKEEKIELVKRESPELIPLMEDYNKKIREYLAKWHPIHELIVAGKLPPSSGTEYVRAKVRLSLGYCMNIKFYLMLKRQRDPGLANHPVIGRLVQFREALKKLGPLDETAERKVEKLLAKIQKGEEIDSSKKTKSTKSNDKDSGSRKEETATQSKPKTKTKPKPKKTPKSDKKLSELLSDSESEESEEEEEETTKRESNPEGGRTWGRKRKAEEEIGETEDEKQALEYYKMMKRKKGNMDEVQEEENEEDCDEEGYEAREEEEEEDGEEGGKRGITYQMEKNKGLTPKRKKEQRNPRVKHRNKYRKAKIRRRGQIREVRTEMHRYGGETSGIRAGIKCSIKLK